MPPKIKNDPKRVVLSQSTLQNMDQTPNRNRTTLAQGIPSMAPLPPQEDEPAGQDSLSLCSSTHPGHGTPNRMTSWALNDADVLDNISSTNPESPEVQLLSFSLSQQLLPPTVGPRDVMYHTGSDFPVVPGVNDHNDLDFSQPQDLHHYSPFVDFTALDNDVCTQNGAQSRTPDDALSTGQSSQNDDGHLVAPHETWSSMMTDTRSYHGSSLDQLPPSIFQPVPASPPLTESDGSTTSACSHSGYPAFIHDDALMNDAPPSSLAPVNPGDPLFPISPPLSAKDRNRTVRPPKQARRPALHVAESQRQVKDQDLFQPLPTKETIKPKPKEAELRNPRDHPYYSLPAHSDGKYYCPFINGEKPCNHPPTTQKCAYHKYLDSHLKPYRCKVAACVDAQLQFSSNACLFRHEREAHGLHGHGDNPYLCLFEGCERSVPGYGFPRRWNLFDHMRRVHDYTSSERPSSPENSPSSGQAPRKRENAGRKRRVTGAAGAQNMKRTRPVHSQTNAMKASQAPTHHGQRLMTAEKNYYNCRTRLLQELGNITPKDSAMHEKANASLQELMTLGLNYRHVEASQAAAQMTHGRPA